MPSVDTILCVHRSGGWCNHQHVVALQGLCAMYAPGIRFVALSDESIEGVEVIPLANPELPGWWAKVDLFRPDLGQLGRIFFMDLDTVIIGDLTPFIESSSGKPIITSDWYYGGPSQSLLIYEGGELEKIYKGFWDDPKYWMTEGDKMKKPNFGDQILVRQEFSGSFRYIQDEFSGLVGSFKVTFNSNNPTANCRIVGFHGKPRPDDISQRWILEYHQCKMLQI